MPRAALAVLLTLALAPSASAAGWTGTVDLLPPGAGADYTVQALGPAGDAAIVWTDFALTGAPVFASTRAPGEPFGPPVQMTPAPGGGTMSDAAIDGAGNLIVVFVHSGTGIDPTLYARVRPRGGSFSEPVALSQPMQDPRNPRIAMNAAGKAVVAWVDAAPAVDIARASVREPGGAFPAPADAATLAPVADTQVDAAVDAAGTAYVSARHNDEAENPFAVYRRAAGAASFDGPDIVSGTGEQELNHSLGVNAAGHAVLAYTASNSAWAAYAAPGQPFGTAQNLGTYSNTSAPSVALDAAGNALVAWTNSDHAVLVRRPAGGAAGAIETIGGPGSRPFDLAMTPDGGFAILTYEMKVVDEVDDQKSFDRVHVSRGSFAGAFAPGEIISPPGTNIDYPFVDMQANGDALVSWYRYNVNEQIPQWRAWDRNPPQLSGVSIPATGVAGQPVAFAASALDTWSPFSLAWAFGDGATSAETAPSHAFAAPGTYDVSVSATDALGQAASSAGQIAIAAAPAQTTIPAVSAFALKPRRFRALRRGGPIAGTSKVKRGTTVRYSLDVAARVIFRVQKRKGKKWRKVKGRFGVDSLAGPNQFRFSGRLRKKKLRPGRYRMVAKPRNGAGTGAVTRAKFRVVRR